MLIVTGFMRSGTSLLCQACEAGGLRVHQNAERDRMNEAASDADYRPNPVSLYESTAAEIETPGWPANLDCDVAKVMAATVGKMTPGSYDVALMLRDPEEIRQSARAAFGINVTLETIEQTIDRCCEELAERIDVSSITPIHYSALIDDPVSVLKWLGWPMDVKAAASVVSPELYRFRRERLTVGI